MTAEIGPAGAPGQDRVRWWHLVLPMVVLVGTTALMIAAWSRFGPDVIIYLFNNGHYTPRLNYAWLHLLMAAAYLSGLIALTLLLGRVGTRRMVADFVPVGSGWIALGAVTGIVLVVVVAVVAAAFAAGGVEFKEHDGIQAAMPQSAGEILLAATTIAILAPFFEELYFRGALLSWLTDKLGLIAAMVVSSAVFAVVHGWLAATPGAQGWIATGLIGVVGIVASILAWRSKSLWPSFAMHAAYNGTMVAAFIASEVVT